MCDHRFYPSSGLNAQSQVIETGRAASRDVQNCIGVKHRLAAQTLRDLGGIELAELLPGRHDNNYVSPFASVERGLRSVAAWVRRGRGRHHRVEHTHVKRL